MAAEKSIGIVLRIVEFSETSVIATLMTRDFGKITAMAKGARRRKSPFEAALDVLACCRIVFLHKTSGAMSLLTEAKLERRFRSSSKDLNRLYAGYYIVELLNSLTDEGDPHPELFDLANDLIQEIDSDDFDTAKLGLKLLDFELQTLELLGHKPMLTKCSDCGREKTSLTRVSFGLNTGGIICKGCRRGKSNIVSLSAKGLEFLLGMVGGKIGTSEANSDNWSPKEQAVNRVRENGKSWQNNQGSVAVRVDQDAALNEARQLINKYITHILGFPPRLYKFLKNI